LPPELEEEEAQDEEEEFDEGDEGDVGDEQEQDTPPSGDPSNVPPPPPSPNPNLPHTLTWAGRLPHPKPYDATFLQSFANLQMNFAGLRGVHCDAIGFSPHGWEDGFY